MVIDFLNNLFNLILALFFLRWIQLKLDPNGDAGKALAYLIH